MENKKVFLAIAVILIFALGITAQSVTADDSAPPRLPPSLRPEVYDPLLLYPGAYVREYGAFPKATDGSSTRIVGGSSYSPENLYPWLVSLRFGGGHYCGGTLIGAEWVLTAAHCWTYWDSGSSQYLQYPVTEFDTVVLGEYDFSVVSGNEQEIDVAAVYRHSSYDPYDNNPWQEYDYALVKLASPAVLNGYVQPIDLIGASPGNLDNTPAKIVGWGDYYYGDPGSYNSLVNHASINILPDSACSNYGAEFDPNTQLCGGVADFSRDACQGDSGGGMYVDVGGTMKVAGIVSWGDGCANAAEGKPGIYSDVSVADSWIISILGVIPDVPTPISPSGAITDTTPTFTWSKEDFATVYRLAVYDIQAASYIITTNLSSGSVCGSSTCSYTHSSALPDSEYKWKVLANNVTGSSAYSAFLEFTLGNPSVLPTPDVPTLIAPDGLITQTQPTFTWSKENNATAYRLAVYDLTNRTYVILANVSLSACGATTCSYNPSISFADGYYKWKVRAANADGSSPYSPYLYFLENAGGTMPEYPDIPAPIAPNSVVDTPWPQFSWTKETNTTWYRLAIYDINARAYVQTANLFSPTCNTTTCWYTFDTALENGNYKWKVRSANDEGYVYYSNFLSFEVDSDTPIPPFPPTQISPSGTISDTTPEFVWSKVNSATLYRLAVYDIDAASYVVVVNLDPSICDTTVCRYEVPSSLGTGQFKWKVYAKDDVGTGPYSSFMYFDIN